MNDFDSDFELELHESRPAPRGELLDSLVSKVSARPASARKSRWQLRLAGVMTAAALVALAALGGVSAASNAISHSNKAGHHEQGDDGRGHDGQGGDGDDGDHDGDDGDHHGHGGQGDDGDHDEHGGHREHHGKRVAICLNGSTVVIFVKPKKANKIVNIKHRGVFATGHPPTCPVI
jgi:hypothetical protein